MKKKIWIIGSSGAGKSLFSRELSERSGHPLHCLDDLFWLPGWQIQDPSSFSENVSALLKKESWIIEGVYSQISPLLLEKADSVVWLDIPLRKLLFRVLKRSLKNIAEKNEICNGNRETFRNLFSKRSIILFLLKSYRSNHKEYCGYFEYLRTQRPQVATFRVKNNANTLIDKIIGAP